MNIIDKMTEKLVEENRKYRLERKLKSIKVQKQLFEKLSKYKTFNLCNTLGAFHVNHDYNNVFIDGFGFLEFEQVKNNDLMGHCCLGCDVITFEEYQKGKFTICFDISDDTLEIYAK